MIRWLPAVLLAGCSSSAVAPQPQFIHTAAPVEPLDSGTFELPDASERMDSSVPVDSEAPIDVSDAADSSERMDSSEPDAADSSEPVDSGGGVDAADSAPDHIGTVWCEADGTLYIACDGNYHGYDVEYTDVTGHSGSCPGSRINLSGTCPVGAQCFVYGVADVGSIIGTCQ